MLVTEIFTDNGAGAMTTEYASDSKVAGRVHSIVAVKFSVPNRGSSCLTLLGGSRKSMLEKC